MFSTSTASTASIVTKLLLIFSESVLFASALPSTLAIAVDRVAPASNKIVVARGMSATADCAGSSGPIVCSVPKNITLDDTYRQFMTARELHADLPRGGPFTKGPFDVSTDEALLMYSFIKQGSVGDINVEAPGMFNFEAKYKYMAWKKLEGMPCDDARAQYVQHLLRVLRDANNDLGRKYVAIIEAA
ncbi:BQ2448_2030 [Microbotryum intermedium]|uniref:BQ2448_2030 protein n=1 Tax=Microbotryum intermedium TaxID=269621 RepID=A0A238F503_9BASI|nr:BQ2448_2030 [Microbotryum intermedium]